MGALGACGAVLLPADIYWEIASPQDDFGSHVSAPMCTIVAGTVGYPLYVAGGFPIYAGKKIASRMSSMFEPVADR